MSGTVQIFENNRKWVADRKSVDPDFFKNLAKGQNPDFLFIGCCDSRVPAEEIMGLQPGELFVHRNVGNIVDSDDRNTMTVIDFAVKTLGVKHIIICGHTGCGGVENVLNLDDTGSLEPWLKNIRKVKDLMWDDLSAYRSGKSRQRRLVELNVEAQCKNLNELALIKKNREETGFPQIHGWIFDIQTGYLIDLQVNL